MEYNGEEVNVPAGDGISLGIGVFESAGAMGGAQELINIRDKIIGITNFFMRLAMVFSILTVGLVFTSTGWEEYTPTPGVDEILGLKLLVTLFPGLALGVTLLCLYFYPYPKERVQEIKKLMAELHEKKMKKAQTR